MSFTILDCEQRSEMWFAARVGRLTGSSAAAMMTEIKSGEAAARRDLRVRLALERITGRAQENEFTTSALQHGIDTEPAALGIYEAMTGQILERTGFLSLDSVQAGCSLDAFVNGRKGIVEAKCPKSATHYEYLKTKQIPKPYRWQCLHNMWVSDAEWCDFVSYDDRFPEHLQYLCVRMERNASEILTYATAAGRFLAEVAVEVADISKLKVAA